MVSSFRRTKKSFIGDFLVLVFYLAFVLASIAIAVAPIFVIGHFVLKYW